MFEMEFKRHTRRKRLSAVPGNTRTGQEQATDNLEIMAASIICKVVLEIEYLL